MRNFRGVEILSGRGDIFSGGVAIFSGGVETFSGEVGIFSGGRLKKLRFFREGLRLYFRERLRFFSGGVEIF